MTIVVNKKTILRFFAILLLELTRLAKLNFEMTQSSIELESESRVSGRRHSHDREPFVR